MIIIILNLINLITAIVLTFLLIILPGYSWRKNFYFILLISFLVLDLILIHLQMIDIISISEYIPFGLTLIVWYGPSFYFHSTKSDFSKIKQYLVHLLCVAAGLWFVFIVAWNFDQTPRWLPTAYFVPVLVVYWIFALRNSTKDQWTIVTSYWFALLTLFFAVESVWGNINLDSLLEFSGYMVLIFHVINLVFVSVSFWFIVRNPEVFSNIRLVRRYRHSIKDLSKSELKIVEAFVSEEKNYLDEGLSRQRVTEATGISQNRISEIVNGYFNKNFNEWVNDFRVEEAKKALREERRTIKEIYYSVGFSSKSVFNNAFKLREGMTPSEFRKSIKS